MSEALAGLDPAIRRQTAHVGAECLDGDGTRRRHGVPREAHLRALQPKQTVLTKKPIAQMMPLTFKSVPQFMTSMIKQACAEQHGAAGQK